MYSRSYQIPVVMNAVGGILVGLVTAHAGGVKKASRKLSERGKVIFCSCVLLMLIFLYCTQGFVIVSALLVTALLQFVFDGKPPSVHCLGALPLVIISIVIYQKYPYVARKKED